jgi:hypothetical protein
LQAAPVTSITNNPVLCLAGVPAARGQEAEGGQRQASLQAL